MPEPPDFVVSGMNAGSNAGINVLYSGTVAAAIEAAFYRQTSFAVSLQYTKPPRMNFEQAAAHARRAISQILAQSPPKGTLFNINIPSTESGPVKGIRVVPQNVSSYLDRFDRRVDPRGRTYFWSGNEINCPEPHPDSDVTAMDEGYITVTPLQFDLTNAAMLQLMKGWEWSFAG
jgi:5'-nucleotidase